MKRQNRGILDKSIHVHYLSFQGNFSMSIVNWLGVARKAQISPFDNLKKTPVFTNNVFNCSQEIIFGKILFRKPAILNNFFYVIQNVSLKREKKVNQRMHTSKSLYFNGFIGKYPLINYPVSFHFLFSR